MDIEFYKIAPKIHVHDQTTKISISKSYSSATFIGDHQ